MSRSRASLSLQTLISSAIVVAMLVVAAVIFAISYQYSRELVKDATLDRIHLVADELNSLMERTFLPAERTLELLSWDELTAAETTEERLSSLPKLTDLLRKDQVIDAIYLGYEDGDFMLVRPIRSESVREIVKAPVDTAFVGEFIEQDGQQQWRFYNDQLEQLGQRIDPKVSYDPRVRPWFDIAQRSSEMQVSEPYIFFTTREVGMTLSKSAQNRTIIGVDYALNDLTKLLAANPIGEGVELALVTPDLRIIASPQIPPLAVNQAEVELPRLNQYPALTLNSFANMPTDTLEASESGDYLGYRFNVFDQWNIQMDLMVSIPEAGLIGDVTELQTQASLVALGLTLFMLAGGWWIGRRISQPLHALTKQVEQLAAFDFTQTLEQKSGVKEVDELAIQLSSMTATISRFRKIAHTLAAEPDTDRMLHRVNHLLAETVGGRRSLIYLYDFDQRQLTRASHYGQSSGTPEQIDGVPEDAKSQVQMLRDSLPKGQSEYLIIPLFNRDNESLGLIEIELYDQSLRKNADYRAFVKELSGLAATALSTRAMLEEQRNLTEAIIKLLADAIDAKSPYTHGHCARVPELAKLLIQATERSTAEPFKDFKLDDQQRYTVQVASWLHDCGKITSPEYVVDKAVKLETLYNRIHEIRTRFEVLWRDAEIAYLKGLLEKQNETDLRNKLKARRIELHKDFELIAEANIGDVPLKPENLERLKEIANQEWTRHFDRRIGLSYAEAERLRAAGHELETPPTQAKLLEDRADHLISWGDRIPPVTKDDPNNRWGFDMELTEHARNLGELYNLSVPRGTLTEEERFKVNEHVVQSIIMLESLPLPRFMRAVPDIAGNHHERMDGKGYPRKLNASELSIPARIMAIADVFEALTASDRPYKPAKKLSQALTILAYMAAEGHIDPEIFKLFVEEEVYAKYAEAHLEAEQRDAVDKRAILKIFESRMQPETA